MSEPATTSRAITDIFVHPKLFLAVDGVHSIPRFDTTALIIAGAVAVVFMGLGLPAISALWKEIIFYKMSGWDFKRDSNVLIYRQKEFVTRFWFIPLGIIKLLFHFNKILMMLIVVIPLGVGAIRSFS